MKPLIFMVVMIMAQCIMYGQAGLKGRIIDEDGENLSDVTIYIQKLQSGTSSNSKGYFQIELKNGDYTVSFSSLGSMSKNLNVSVDNEIKDLGDIILYSSPTIMDEVVISVSRKMETITKTPATIDLINSTQLVNLAGSPEELIALQKGIDFTRVGAFWGSINVRGFNSAFNQKMLILDDNRITNIRMRTPVGPLSPFVKEDVERVEIVLGPSSALYGPNSLNGLFYTISKSPFTYPGTEVVLGTGSNKLFNTRVRHAQVINKKWAYKVTSEYISGEERQFTDSVYVVTPGTGEIQGKAEIGVDRSVSFFKLLAATFYKPTADSEIGLNYALSENSSISVGNVGRNNLKNWDNSSLQATYKSPQWFGQFYKTWIKLDRSTNILPRTLNYYTLLEMGQSEEVAFENSLDGPRQTSTEDDSYRLNGELQYQNNWGNLNYVSGVQYQKEQAYSNHTFLLDKDGPIELYQHGIYGHLDYDIKKTGVTLNFAARADDHSLFGFNFLPKAGITYTKNNGTLRLTYGKGYAVPSLINTYLNLGGGIVLGNSDGFTLSDGSKIPALGPETIKTLEMGYKNIFFLGKLYADVDAYYNWSRNLISPIVNIAPNGLMGGAVVTHKGDRPITEYTQGVSPGAIVPGAVINTTINFGRTQTYGFDIGLKYYLSDTYNITFNYSFLDYDLDRNDPKNDANFDGRVTDNDLAINTPKNKMSSAFTAHFNKFYATLFARWVQKYDFFSGRNVAARSNPETIYDGDPVIEGQRVGDQYNYGPLGGFYLSFNGNYQITKMLTMGAYVNNILGTGNYEFVASAPSETIFGLEVKCSLFND